MNERIQELAYEAEEYADTIVDQGGEFHPAYTKKFAELIVRECANKLLLMHKDSHDRHNYYHFAANRIRDHFYES